MAARPDELKRNPTLGFPGPGEDVRLASGSKTGQLFFQLFFLLLFLVLDGKLGFVRLFLALILVFGHGHFSFMVGYGVIISQRKGMTMRAGGNGAGGIRAARGRCGRDARRPFMDKQ